MSLDYAEIFQGIGTFLLGCVGVYNSVQSTLAKRAARRASIHASTAITSVEELKTTVQTLEVNTNSKMDQLIAAREATADAQGEKRGTALGIAQELARRNKEET
jgi:hypothetical protein